ncbi:hypothetical protein CK505_13725 [Kocuria sp. WN036]|nr:hypothetical protein CK505_13725 [Kocuria sp. WN036]
MAVLARTRPGAGHDPEQSARASLKRLALRHRNLAEEITVVDHQLEQIVAGLNPALPATYGVGPVVAATLLATVADNPDRIRTPAAFAALCGVAPVPASPRRTHRHRLSRGGDRQANHACTGSCCGACAPASRAPWRTSSTAGPKDWLTETSSGA